MTTSSPGGAPGAVPHAAPKNNLGGAFGRPGPGGGKLGRLGAPPITAVPSMPPEPTEPAVVDLREGTGTTWVQVETVAMNPLNDRDEADYTDLSDLTSMETLGQHTACGVVTVAAFLRLFPLNDPNPEYRAAAEAVKDASYVVVMGTRRRVAAETFGIGRLKVDINDDLAANRADFIAYVASENLDRRNLTLLQEARVVERLARELGSGAAAGDRLKKSRAWVSQRRSILKLVPELQELVRTREILVEDARHLGGLDPDVQLQAWKDMQQRRATEAKGLLTAVNAGQQSDKEPRAGRPRQWRFTERQTPDEVSSLLLERFGGTDLDSLIELLTAARGR